MWVRRSEGDKTRQQAGVGFDTTRIAASGALRAGGAAAWQWKVEEGGPCWIGGGWATTEGLAGQQVCRRLEEPRPELDIDLNPGESESLGRAPGLGFRTPSQVQVVDGSGPDEEVPSRLRAVYLNCCVLLPERTPGPGL